MKIVYFIDNLGFGGKERRLVELLKALDIMPDMQLDLVLAKDQIVYKEIFDTKVNIHYALRKGVKKDPRVFLKFYKIVKKINPDIIHVWGNLEAVYAIPTKLMLNIPLINSQIANTPTQLAHFMLNHKLTFPFADRIIGNSKSGLKAYNAPAKKSKVIYNGFDFLRISKLSDPEVVKKKYDLKKKFIVGMVASFAARKDYGTFMKAINELVARDNEFTFLCIGDGDKNEYREMLTEKAIEQTLFFDHQDEVESIMQICDIGVLTTITEGIPNSILEFMALGKPVVVAGGGGCSELILQGKNGFLLKTGDHNGVVEKLLFLKENPEIRIDFGRASRNIVEKNFSMSVMVDRYLEEYNRYFYLNSKA